MNANFKSELNWLAFRYAAGELAAEEAAQFELRLADEQAAREALAGAVELGELLTHVPAKDWTAPVELAPNRSRTWLHYASWALVGAAACLLVVFASGKFGGEKPGPAPSGTPELAEAWSRGFEAVNAIMPEAVAPLDEEFAALEAFEAEATETENEGGAADAIVEPAPLAVPSWMLAAVSKEDMPQHPESNNTDVRIE